MEQNSDTGGFSSTGKATFYTPCLSQNNNKSCVLGTPLDNATCGLTAQ